MRRYPYLSEASLDPNDPHRTTKFNDYYFAISDPIGERQSVFIDGNSLPKRFRSLQPGSLIRIGETGFGAGLTFIVACINFLNEASRDARLQWISTEQYPLRTGDLIQSIKALPLTTDMEQLAEELIGDWPDPIPTCHRRFFGDGRIILDLHFNDSTSVINDLSGTIDAWCLDGFAPERNPEIWEPALFKAIAEKSHQETTFSTFTSARKVRDGLTSAGFKVEKVPGFARKRERIEGNFTGNRTVNPWTPTSSIHSKHSIAIIGAGLAGAWTAYAFARRRIPVVVFERQTPAVAASGNPQGITYAKLSIEATPNSLLQMQSLAHLKNWFQIFSADNWNQSGVVLLAKNDKERLHQKKLIEALPSAYPLIQSITRQEASILAELPLAYGGSFLPDAGWLNPRGCVWELLDHPLITVIPYRHVRQVKRIEAMSLLEFEGHTLGFHQHLYNAVIWANALEAQKHVPMPLSLKPIRGQITYVQSGNYPKIPICGDAYVAPQSHGLMTCGATYTPNSENLTPILEDDLTNIDTINSLVAKPIWNHGHVTGNRVSIRTATPDYMPVVGQVAESEIWKSLLENLKYDATFQPTQPLPYIRGHYVLAGLGSRGTLTAPIAAELLVSQILGEVLPVSESIRDALSPDRFFRRRLVRGLT